MIEFVKKFFSGRVEVEGYKYTLPPLSNKKKNQLDEPTEEEIKVYERIKALFLKYPPQTWTICPFNLNDTYQMRHGRCRVHLHQYYIKGIRCIWLEGIIVECKLAEELYEFFNKAMDEYQVNYQKQKIIKNKQLLFKETDHD